MNYTTSDCPDDDDNPMGEVNSLLEIDKIRKEAWEEGYATGFADGRNFAHGV